MPLLNLFIHRSQFQCCFFLQSMYWIWQKKGELVILFFFSVQKYQKTLYMFFFIPPIAETFVHTDRILQNYLQSTLLYSYCAMKPCLRLDLIFQKLFHGHQVHFFTAIFQSTAKKSPWPGYTHTHIHFGLNTQTQQNTRFFQQKISFQH